jgi:hypothetical protein
MTIPGLPESASAALLKTICAQPQVQRVVLYGRGSWNASAVAQMWISASLHRTSAWLSYWSWVPYWMICCCPGDRSAVRSPDHP